MFTCAVQDSWENSLFICASKLINLLMYNIIYAPLCPCKWPDTSKERNQFQLLSFARVLKHEIEKLTENDTSCQHVSFGLTPSSGRGNEPEANKKQHCKDKAPKMSWKRIATLENDASNHDSSARAVMPFAAWAQSHCIDNKCIPGKCPLSIYY